MFSVTVCKEIGLLTGVMGRNRQNIVSKYPWGKYPRKSQEILPFSHKYPKNKKDLVISGSSE